MNIESILLITLLACVNFCIYYRQWKIQEDIHKLSKSIDIFLMKESKKK